MGIQHPAELEGQISINELLDKPIGTEPIQLVLPIHFHVPQPSRQCPLPESHIRAEIELSAQLT